MNKKGFTLIELLAIIVILAILITLSVPAIVSITKKSTKNAFKESTQGVISAAEIYFTQHLPSVDTTFNVNGSGLQDVNSSLLIKIDGKSPDSGTITVNSRGKVSGYVYQNNYKLCAIIDEETKNVEVFSDVSENACENVMPPLGKEIVLNDSCSIVRITIPNQQSGYFYFVPQRERGTQSCNLTPSIFDNIHDTIIDWKDDYLKIDNVFGSDADIKARNITVSEFTSIRSNYSTPLQANNMWLGNQLNENNQTDCTRDISDYKEMCDASVSKYIYPIVWINSQDYIDYKIKLLENN